LLLQIQRNLFVLWQDFLPSMLSVHWLTHSLFHVHFSCMWKCTLYPCLYQYIFYLTKFMHTCSFCFIAACFYSRVSVLSGLFYQDVLCWLLRDYSTMYTQTIPYNLHCLYYVCVHPRLSYCYLFSMFCCDEIANLLDWEIWNDHTHTVVVHQNWCIVLGWRLLCLQWFVYSKWWSYSGIYLL
jgi:hypothetical protein